MNLPGYNEEFEVSELAEICEKLCVGLKKKHPKWERFVLEPEKKKSEKYKGL